MSDQVNGWRIHLKPASRIILSDCSRLATSTSCCKKGVHAQRVVGQVADLRAGCELQGWAGHVERQVPQPAQLGEAIFFAGDVSTAAAPCRATRTR